MASLRPAARRFDHDMARALRAEGAKIRDIAELYGVATNAVHRQVADINCPVDHLAVAFKGTSLRAREQRSKIAAERRAKIRQLRSTGLQYKAIARIVGLSLSQVSAHGLGVKPYGQRQQPAVASKVALPPERNSAHPVWIVRSGLLEDYLDHFRLYGREAALRFCRQLHNEAQQ